MHDDTRSIEITNPSQQEALIPADEMDPQLYIDYALAKTAILKLSDQLGAGKNRLADGS